MHLPTLVQSSSIALLLTAWTMVALGCAGGASQNDPTPGARNGPCRAPEVGVAPDESSVELAVADYLREQGLHVEFRDRGDDGALFMGFDSDGIEYSLAIDTQFSAKDESERVIHVRLYSGVIVPPDQQPAFLSVMNVHHAAYWAGQFYINPEDGEIEGKWAINMPGQCVHPELVHDATLRLGQSWLELRPKLPDAKGAETTYFGTKL